ncbi:MAG: 30S ribosomal protein S6 [Candidatus Levybacteria bacterium RIFCSPLOWO2_01_FULL_36_13]|nr:MAG: 30S ribosomal protein S6 [Candidatus Levybacteria bacterium RIFCSPHIGHO2_01_FULL_36_15b]OGH35422.1 MAG: 30S ribosomal protein S6 [Candidatus Levybacteria bacterium RIFCSPLOWO2_01_FULL_36_13]
MRKYQLTLVTKSSDSAKKKAIDSVKGMLKAAKIEKEEELGEKDLAYSIKRETKGFYTNYLFSADSLPAGFEKRLNADENVLRFLVIKL